MIKRITTVILAVICLLPLTLSVAYADFANPSTLTVVLRYDGGPLSGIRIAICRVAQIREDKGNIVFDTVPAFSGAGVDLTDLSTEKNVALAAVLNAYASAHNIGRNIALTDNGGGAFFKDLSAGLYLVAQDDSENSEYIMAPYMVMVPSLNPSDREPGYNVISHPKTEPTRRNDETVSVSVFKLWEGAGSHPTGVQAQLYRNGAPHGSPSTLNSGNYWSYTWNNLSPNYTWTVDEVEMPAGYMKTVSGGVRNGFIITNAKDPTCTPSPTPTPTTALQTTPTNKPGSTGAPYKSPKTEDTANMWLWITLIAVSSFGLIAILLVLNAKRPAFACKRKKNG